MHGGTPVYLRDVAQVKDAFKEIRNIRPSVAMMVMKQSGSNTVKTGKPELQIVVDGEKASQTGLSVGRVAETVKAAMLGVVPTKYRIEGDEYDHRRRLRPPLRDAAHPFRHLRRLLAFRPDPGTLKP